MNTQERIEGPTPTGGDYAIAYWQDGQGNPCEKDQAKAAEIVEYSANGDHIMRTYMETSHGPDATD